MLGEMQREKEQQQFVDALEVYTTVATDGRERERERERKLTSALAH